MTTEIEAARQETVGQVHRLLEASGLTRPDMLVTDIVVVAVQRGFNLSGGTSMTVTLVPTDTPQPMVVGMLKMAVIEHDERVASLYRLANDYEPPEDEDASE